VHADVRVRGTQGMDVALTALCWAFQVSFSPGSGVRLRWGVIEDAHALGREHVDEPLRIHHPFAVWRLGSRGVFATCSR